MNDGISLIAAPHPTTWWRCLISWVFPVKIDENALEMIELDWDKLKIARGGLKMLCRSPAAEEFTGPEGHGDRTWLDGV